MLLFMRRNGETKTENTSMDWMFGTRYVYVGLCRCMYITEDKSRWLVRVEEKLEGGLALIHYKGWRYHFDEAVPRTSLRPKPSDDISVMVKNAQFLDTDRFHDRSTKPSYPCIVSNHPKPSLSPAAAQKRRTLQTRQAPPPVKRGRRC